MSDSLSFFLRIIQLFFFFGISFFFLILLLVQIIQERKRQKRERERKRSERLDTMGCEFHFGQSGDRLVTISRFVRRGWWEKNYKIHYNPFSRLPELCSSHSKREIIPWNRYLVGFIGYFMFANDTLFSCNTIQLSYNNNNINFRSSDVNTWKRRIIIANDSHDASCKFKWKMIQNLVKLIVNL